MKLGLKQFLRVFGHNLHFMQELKIAWFILSMNQPWHHGWVYALRIQSPANYNDALT